MQCLVAVGKKGSPLGSQLAGLPQDAAPSAGLLRNKGLPGHLADHVVEDASVVEISKLHISVESHDNLEGFSCIQL